MASKSGEKRDTPKKPSKKAIKELISKGKKQGYLTYDEINAVLPDDMVTSEQLDETLIILGDLDIEVVSEVSQKSKEIVPKTKEKPKRKIGF